MMRPPVIGPGFLFLPADASRWGIVDLSVLYDPSRSISTTLLNALAERRSMGARKLPAAPAL